MKTLLNMHSLCTLSDRACAYSIEIHILNAAAVKQSC